MRPLAILALLCAVYDLASAARPGDLDPTFGTDGTVRVPVRAGGLNDVLVLPDGTLLVGGTGDPEDDGTAKLLVARFDASGAIVPEFGNGGIVTTRVPLADGATVRRLTLDPDGRILAAGISHTLLATGELSSLLKLARYFPDGQLDRDFGTSGIRSAVIANDVAGIVVGDDRSITFVGQDDNLIAGRLLIGSGAGSFQLPSPSSGGDLVPHAGGLLMGGTAGGDFFLMRLVNGFNFDTQFGDGGSVRTPIGGAADRLRKLLVLPDGGIIAIGTTFVGGIDRDIAIVRYSPDGVVDPTFGNGGIVVTSLGPRTDDVRDAVLAPDGSMLVAGRTCSPAPPCQGFLARLRPDGSLDPDFGDAGVVVVGTTRLVAGIAMPDDGHVVAVGPSTEALAVSRFVVATCGNGRVETGEACDGGDCCSPACTFEPDDTSCDDDGSACTADLCRAGTCTHVVPDEAGCFAATSSTFARVRNDVAGDRLRWTWQSTAPVDRASFGDPTDATDVTVCVVDGAGESERPLVELNVPAAGICNGTACWKATPRGFRFSDVAGVQGGVTVLRLVSGADGGRIKLKAKNVRGVSDLPAPLRVRLIRLDARECFEADLAPVPGAALRFQSR
jgi:uncharacterized delta-60 repeat protein